MPDPLVIVGAGAFAREVHDWVTQAGGRVAGFYAPAGDGPTLRGLPVFRAPSDVPSGARWVAGVGTPTLLHRLAGELGARVPPASAVVHPSAVVGSNVTIGPGAIVCPGTILTCDIEVGTGAVLNLACTVGHDSRIGAWSVLSPRVSLSGRTVLGRGVSMGTAATTIPGVRVADCSVVGAGAVVVRDLEPGVHVGVPAKLARPLKDAERLPAEALAGGL